MKIQRVIESFYPYVNGPAKQAFKISSELEKRNIKSPIFTTNYKAQKSSSFELFDNVKVSRFENNFTIMKYCISFSLYAKLKNQNFDIIHAHNYRSFPSEIAYKIARSKKKPFVINTHGSMLGYSFFLSHIKQLPYKLYDFFSKKGVVRNANKVVVSSKVEFNEAIKFGIDKNKISIIPMGINVDDYNKKYIEHTKKIKLLFVGRISKDRNLDPLIDAMKILAKESVELNVVGPFVKRSDTDSGNYYMDLVNRIKKMKLSSYIHFVGAKYGKELIKYYQNADIFVYTSLYENFGQTILEAAAAGLPIISTPVGVALDIVENKKTGFIVNFNDKNAIIESVQKLRDESKRKRYGEKIKDIVKKNFSWDKVILKYLKVYNNLLKK